MVIASISETLLVSSLIPFIGSLTNPDINYIGHNFLNRFFSLNKDTTILIYLIIFIFTILCTALSRLINLKMSSDLAALIGSDMTIKCFENTLYQTYETHINWNTSKLLASITTEVSITVTALNNLLQILVSFMIALGLLITLFLINWKIALSSILIFFSSYIFIGGISKKKLAFKSKQFAYLNDKEFKTLQESYGAIREVILDDNQDFYISNFSKENRIKMKVKADNQFIASYPKYILEAICLLVLIIISYYLYSSDPLLASFIPTISAFALGSLKMLPAFQQIYLGWAVFKGSEASIQNVLDLLTLPVNLQKKIKSKDSKFYFQTFLKINNLVYKYPNTDKVILKNLNFYLKKGECIGIVGTSGSGKSTFIDLIMGLLTPLEGQIEVDGRDINKQKIIKEWQQQISHVPQNIFLADCSILENITLGIQNKKVNLKHVQKVLEIARLKDFVDDLPFGLDTKVGEKGVKISGGQKQRLGLARALYKDTPILILDEATSALDEKNEKLIIDSILNDRQKKTIIMISHRKQTLQKCDKVYEINNGFILEKKDFFK